MTRMRTRVTRSALIGAAVLALVTTGFGAAAPAATPAASIPAPPGLPSFYSVPLPIPGFIGKLMKSQLVSVSGLHGTMYRVMYQSTTVDNKPIAVTGVIAVPNGTPPVGGFPVVSWGHGTNGMADICAPSLNPGSDVPLANTLLDQGWVVTASDYQG